MMAPLCLQLQKGEIKMESQIKLSEVKRAASVIMVIFGLGALLNAACAIWFATGFQDQNGHAAKFFPLALLIALFSSQIFIEAWLFRKQAGNLTFIAKRQAGLAVARYFTRNFTLLSILFLGYASFAHNWIALVVGALFTIMAFSWWKKWKKLNPVNPDLPSPLPALKIEGKKFIRPILLGGLTGGLLGVSIKTDNLLGIFIAASICLVVLITRWGKKTGE